MKIVLALALNAAFLYGLYRWLRRERQVPELGRYLLPTLALRILAGWLNAAMVLLKNEGDALQFERWARLLTAQFWAEPRGWLHTLWGDSFQFESYSLVYHGHSNTFFIMKVLSVLNLASLGNTWLNSLYLSVLGFGGCWLLVRCVTQYFPEARVGAILAFLLWPSVLYWASGITKESLLLGSAAGLVAVVVRWLYGPTGKSGWLALGALVLATLVFKMRFFFAAFLFVSLAGLALVRFFQLLGTAKQRWLQVLIFLLVPLLGGWLAGEVSPVFRFNKFSNQLIHNYTELLADSRDRPHIEFKDLAPTAESMAVNAPEAFFSALFRPFPGESASPLFVVAAVENVVLLLLLALTLASVLGGKTGPLPFAVVVALLFYCVVVLTLIGLSTPNLGTLNRYRAGVLPFLVLVQNAYVTRWLRRWPF
ncbi:hypothetical protein LJY25_01275 [Hymenobacter sp. BT175]|uniref:hypothetical protein n=1 Tax=Hymenobacter translucens TaxID=2886507 RepID=UPI001D0EC551|nr:hypothetical protein [Hymenobacter translucens]MCC2545061.1 hypothetical protein [Hymenobacter translucens]